MKKLLCVVFALLCMSAAPIAKNTVKKSNGINLTKNNLVVLRGEINGESISKAMVQIMSMSNNHPILFIASPGGSIIDGMQFVQFLKDSGKKVTCIADRAFSMAFAIMQACDKRVVMENSEMMQHLASFGLQGPAANLKTQYEHILSIVDSLEKMQAKRMHKDLEQFRKDRLSDLWLYGKKIVEYGAADSLEKVTCDKDLWTDTVKEEQVLLGTLKVQIVYSACPLARDPIK